CGVSAHQCPAARSEFPTRFYAGAGGDKYKPEALYQPFLGHGCFLIRIGSMKTQPRKRLSRPTHSVTKKDYLSSCVFLRHLGLSLRLPSSFLVLPAVSILHSEFFTLPCSTPSAGAAAPLPGCFPSFLSWMQSFRPFSALFWTVSAPKQSSVAAVFILALGLLLSSTIGSLWQLYIFFGLISAVGITFTGMVPHVFLVSEWFVANRASAIGFVYAGTGVGILLLAPLSEWLLSTWGWPRAFQTFSGIVLLLLLPLVWIFYQHGPFGERLRSKKESKPNEHRWTAKLALRSWQFWLLFFARICAASGTTVIVTHQVAHVVDVGYSKLLAATIFGLAGITSSF